MRDSTRAKPRARSSRSRWASTGLFGGGMLLVIAGLVLAWQFVQPAPPRTISIATGNSDGAYYRYAERYRAILARNGIELCIIETSGSVENLRRLRSETDPVDLAFVQGGVATDEQREQLSGLGSLLIAATANLVATPSLHPALVDLLISAAYKVHGGGSLLAEPGTFPSPRNSDFPLNPDAKRHYKHGPPLLQRYLPFWAASWMDRLKVMLLPLIGLMLPLVKLLPPVYRWGVRRRIFQWYLKLRRIDLEIETTDLTPRSIDELHGRIERIESDAALADLPVSYTDQLYHLRLHIQLLRSKLEELSRIKSAG